MIYVCLGQSSTTPATPTPWQERGPTWRQLKFRGGALPGWASCCTFVGVLFSAWWREVALSSLPRVCLRKEKTECDRVLCVQLPNCMCRAEQGPALEGLGAVPLWGERKLPGSCPQTIWVVSPECLSLIPIKASAK